ncbi:hypothetical protein OHV05_24705 [Kitasatospora sp. NBC_00070]|uniref:hypothetical protein n=1 Tax=Kitasatospora sp. NBC_00070 TaxID=2975962 RepID=UPI00324DD9D0
MTNVQSGKSVVAAGTGVLFGTILMVVGAASDNIGLAVVGAAALMVAAMVTCLIILLRQLRDTSAERRALHQQLEGYLAAEAGVVAERERIRKDLVANAALTREAIDRECRSLRQTFEEERFELTSRAYRLGAEAAISGALDVAEPPTATVFRLPIRQAPEVSARAAVDD